MALGRIMVRYAGVGGRAYSHPYDIANGFMIHGEV